MIFLSVRIQEFKSVHPRGKVLFWSFRTRGFGKTRVDRHDLYEGGKTEEFKKQTDRQTKKGGRRPRRSLRIRSGLTFLYLCIYEIYARSPLYPARMIKNKHARFFAISHPRDVPNKKNRPMLARGCGNTTCHKFTVIPFPVRNAFALSFKKIQLDTQDL